MRTENGHEIYITDKVSILRIKVNSFLSRRMDSYRFKKKNGLLSRPIVFAFPISQSEILQWLRTTLTLSAAMVASSTSHYSLPPKLDRSIGETEPILH